MALWEATHRRVCLVIIGDVLQLPSIAGTNASDSYTWKDVTTITLHEMVRCKCPLLEKKLTCLRTHVPDHDIHLSICRGHKAWNTAEPTAWDILQLFRKTEGRTTVATISKAAAALVNALATQVLFRDKDATLWGKWNANGKATRTIIATAKCSPPGRRSLCSSYSTKGCASIRRKTH